MEVLGGDAVGGGGEGRVGRRGGLVGAAGDPEGRAVEVVPRGGGGGGQRLEAVAEEELEEDAVDLHADARHGSPLSRIRASHGTEPWGRDLGRRRWGDRIGLGSGDAGGGDEGEWLGGGKSEAGGAKWRLAGWPPPDDDGVAAAWGGTRRVWGRRKEAGWRRKQRTIERKQGVW